MKEKLEDFARLFKESEDPRFQNLHTLVNNLHLDLHSFKENFSTIIKGLNELFNQKLITQGIYDNCLHTINGDIIIYLHNKVVPVEILIYDCCICKKYFLEMNHLFLKEEVLTKLILNYTSSCICSEKCLRDSYPDLADGIMNKPE